MFPVRKESRERSHDFDNDCRLALLQPQGIEKIVVVTDALHMRRALSNFEKAVGGKRIRIVAAPMGSRGDGVFQPPTGCPAGKAQKKSGWPCTSGSASCWAPEPKSN